MRKHSRRNYTKARGSESRYVVREGDTIRSVAKFLLDSEDCYHLLMAYNHMDTEEIHAGDVIYLPTGNG